MAMKQAQKTPAIKEGGKKISVSRSELWSVKSNWFMGGLATGGAIVAATVLAFTLGSSSTTKAWDNAKDKIEKVSVAETRLKVIGEKLEEFGEEHGKLMEEWDAKKEKFDLRLSRLKGKLEAARNMKGAYKEGSVEWEVEHAKEKMFYEEIETLESKREMTFDSWQYECDLLGRQRERLIFLAQNWDR